MIEERIEAVVASAVNNVANLDPEARKKLRKLEGRSVAIIMRGPEAGVLVTVDDGDIRVSRVKPDQEPEATIRATPGAMLALFGSGGRVAAGQLELSGDTETARRFSEFFTHLKPDWEEGMTRVFGDVAGVHLSRFLGSGARWLKATGERAAEDVSDYLRFEGRQLVDASEVEEFMDAVDDLRDEVAALERRVKKLAK